MTPIFLLRTCKRGFTFIEIMIVVGILAAVMVIGLPRLTKQDQNIKNTIRKIIVLSKQLHNKARLEKKTYRMAIQMDELEGYSFWAEMAPSQVLLLTAEQLKEQNYKIKDDDELQKKQNQFQIDEKTIKIQALPKGFLFSRVETMTQSLESGRAYIHYFPQGLVEAATIHITDKKNLNWTVAIHPLTGHADIIKKEITLKELNQQ